ncbi:LSM domain-containing protein [Colletotrichum cuscutae]|uniref:Small nuclear ribonucleoprotein Sm D3 n=1 Tax=Colletotrichum cuscutae TaxID=1209917 RepID=A0AAI9XW80_9PEZI|nr:LSM domain-containing protein [Colletotrichum cuscutae]
MTSTIGIPIKLLNEAQVPTTSPPNKDHARKLTIRARRATSSPSKSHQVKPTAASSSKVTPPSTLPSPNSVTDSSPLTSHLSPTAEDNMNVQLKDITVTARDGRVSHLDQVYIRGSHVRFFIVPDMLRNAPMFRSRNVRGRGVGMARGRATVSRARASGRGGR